VDRQRAGTARALGFATLAALAKSTGLGVLAVVALDALRRARRDAGAIARVAAWTAAALGVVVALHYGRLVAETGSLRALFGGGDPADRAGSEMAAQPPGERRLAHYVSFPAATLVAPFKDAPGMAASVPGLLYATTWADGQGEFLPVQERRVVAAAAVSALLGLVPTALAAVGLLRMLRKRALRERAFVPLLFGALLAAAFLAQTWVVPRYSAVKASYLLAALLPASLALAIGLDTRRRRAPWRASLLAIALYSTFLTWWGWWR
jgi:hypothetical protein